MTREEVTKHLNILLANRCWDCRERAGSKVCDEKCMFKQAFNEAIEALSADAEQTELPQYEEWQDSFNKMCESAKPKTFVADEWYHNTFKDGDAE